MPPGVVINDPKNLEYVLKNEGIFTKGNFFKRRSWESSMQMVSCGKCSARLDYTSSVMPT
jgi:hypothetical protein